MKIQLEHLDIVSDNTTMEGEMGNMTPLVLSRVHFLFCPNTVRKFWEWSETYLAVAVFQKKLGDRGAKFAEYFSSQVYVNYMCLS